VSSSRHTDKIKRIYRCLKRKREATANEVISSLFAEDLGTLGPREMIGQRGWRYYVHLNKLFAQMERSMTIKFTGNYKVGETGKEEKVWSIL
jgi:hypothetical protein